MSRISDRLSTLKAIKKEMGQQPATRPAKARKPVPPLPGWERDPRGFWKRDVEKRIPFKTNPEKSFLLRPGTKAEEILFYDTETTGLSGGAGNTVFLAGYGFFQDDRFIVRQFFLEDYPGEKEFLLSLTSDWPENYFYASYNGRSFDNPLLKTRFLMNGLPFPDYPQLDLLYPARRLWKTCLPNCALGTLEHYILKKERKEDLPGREAPQAWFDFLKDGNTEKLRLIFEHNLEDIVSLAEILNCMENLSDQKHREIPLDHYGLALLNFARGQERALPMLEQLCQKNHYKALLFLSAYYKKRNLYSKALPLWEQMIRINNSVYAVEETAKYFEHKEKDPDSALKTVEDRLLKRWPLSEKERANLLRRKERLIRKRNKLP